MFCRTFFFTLLVYTHLRYRTFSRLLHSDKLSFYRAYCCCYIHVTTLKIPLFLLERSGKTSEWGGFKVLYFDKTCIQARSCILPISCSTPMKISLQYYTSVQRKELLNESFFHVAWLLIILCTRICFSYQCNDSSIHFILFTV
jgi:hypothetical protein